MQESIRKNKEFLRKNKNKILLLSPLIVGFLFFIYSGISAFITLNTIEVPEEFEQSNVIIKDYEIKEIDRKTNTLKWTLKAKKAEIDQNTKQGRVRNVLITVYEGAHPKFTLEADYAILNNGNKSIRLYDGATLRSHDGLNMLSASEIHFADDKENIEVRGNWKLEKKGTTLTTVTGDEGYISRSFGSILSKGHASLTEGATQLKANELVISKDKPISAKGNARAYLKDGTEVLANELLIYDTGAIKARGNVAVSTPKVSCYSQIMNVEPGADRKPVLAKFSGNPHIVQDGRTVYADSIIYDFKLEEAIIEGNVRSRN